ncbi:MAG: DUF2065 domain-containing protein [Acidiferrobacterales bacterium]
MWRDLLVALALLLVLEGILPFLNPAGMRRTLLLISDMTDSQLRFAGLTSMLIGTVLLYFIH